MIERCRQLVKLAKDMGNYGTLAKALDEILTHTETLAAEVERCHHRLEIDRCFDSNMNEVPIPYEDRLNFPDGIEARDATIQGQDQQLVALRKWRQEAEAALAEKNKEIAALHSLVRQAKGWVADHAWQWHEKADQTLARNAGGNGAKR